MGQRISSGSIRLTNESILALADIVLPGTPVLIFDSSGVRSTRAEIQSRRTLPATTIGFAEGPFSAIDATSLVTPGIWRRCELGGSRSEIDAISSETLGAEIEASIGVPVEVPDGQPLLCRSDATVEVIVPGSENLHVFAVALPDSGQRFNLTSVSYTHLTLPTNREV